MPARNAFALPEALQSFLAIEVVGNGRFFASDLFRRKFDHEPPNFGHHVVVFYRDPGSALHVASYLHMWVKDTFGLIGGGCSDGRVIRGMTEAERAAVERAGGLLLQTLRFTFSRFESGLEAFFGHCGNDRALAVDLQAGFQRTEDPHLLVRWNAPLTELAREQLYRSAIALGAF